MLSRSAVRLHSRRSRQHWQHFSTNTAVNEFNNNNRVVTEIQDNGIAHVILNRPDKLNALDLHMFRALQKAAVELQSNSNIRCVILRGAGRAFCTGLDVKSMMVKSNPITTANELLERHPRPGRTNDDKQKDDDDDEMLMSLLDEDIVAETTNLAQDVGYLWRQLPYPVLCSLHGMCFGGGLQIALGADLRYCTASTQLSVMEAKWGLIPDMSATVTLRELMRIDVAKELTFTGRIVKGEEAAQLGLVTKCIDDTDDPLEYVQQVAQRLVQQSPDALRLSKQLYQQTWVNASEEYCLKTESAFQKKLLYSWNQIAATARSTVGWKLPYFARRRLEDD